MRKNPIDEFFRIICLCSAFMIFLVLIFLFIELILNSWPSIKKFGLSLLWSSSWNPIKQDFGALQSIYGTLITTLIAMVIAIPASLFIAFFLVEISHPILGRVVGEALDLLAAIPSIIYGMWGLFVFAPFMQDYIQPFFSKNVQPILDIFAVFLSNITGLHISLPFFSGPSIGIGFLTAGLILALMVLPFTSAIIRDIFKMVPPVVKESAYGIGSTTWEVARHVTLRYGLQGILGGVFFGLGRAIGETMAITFVIGNAQKISFSLLAPGTTIASTLASQFSEAVSQPFFRSVLLELGLILFIVSFSIQVTAQIWLNRIRKKSGGGL
ncbi:MAG TPA: phosphate ABC transporter permease subunit PstC [Victivallales bacterium]|nr:phosphate ABC transporter permease subunit PstC [Victivallales bacterium]HRR28404.1 phosphate ABC transporter permease subunit PstC [Victivallales bacterium]HRU00691.1 phosphate ABC transporter permease subunit PstC [Victivallales bacterium]